MDSMERRIRMANLVIEAIRARLNNNNELSEAYLDRLNKHKSRLIGKHCEGQK